MINNVLKAKTREYTSRGLTTEKISVTWRHYISGISTYTLFDTGTSTAFPYAYGGIGVPYDAYFSQFQISSMPYSTRQFPSGNSITLSVYIDGVLKGSQTGSHTNNVYESVVLDFGKSIEINRGQVVTLRLQVNGQWWYCTSTSIIIEK